MSLKWKDLRMDGRTDGRTNRSITPWLETCARVLNWKTPSSIFNKEGVCLCARLVEDSSFCICTHTKKTHFIKKKSCLHIFFSFFFLLFRFSKPIFSLSICSSCCVVMTPRKTEITAQMKKITRYRPFCSLKLTYIDSKMIWIQTKPDTRPIPVANGLAGAKMPNELPESTFQWPVTCMLSLIKILSFFVIGFRKKGIYLEEGSEKQVLKTNLGVNKRDNE